MTKKESWYLAMSIFPGRRYRVLTERAGSRSRLRLRMVGGAAGRAATVALGCVAIGVTCAGASAEAACPNEALRQELASGQLPDCRAYELVSPVYKDGTPLDGNNITGVRGAVSEDGSHAILFAFGAFAGTASDPFENTVYELSRGGSDWATSALDPPAAMSPESNFFGASRDLTRTLWGLHRPSQSVFEEDLYVREPDGSFVEIGPMVPPSFGGGPPAGTTTKTALSGFVQTSYITGGGASADLSRVLVSVKGADGVVGDRWPGDRTVAAASNDSLYEYAGTGVTTPELVGVDNEGKQISQCGVTLGGTRGGEKYNALSADGETVFFTAAPGGCTGLNVSRQEEMGAGPPVNDLYARIDRKETVNISEPLRVQCGLCRTGLSEPKVEEMPAEFAGASRDGSKVFFTTEQELLEGQTTSNLYEYDFDASHNFKIVLASPGSATPEVQSVAQVSEDGSHVYFIAKGVLTGANREGQSPTAGTNNLYVFERDAAHTDGRLSFVATLPEASLSERAQATPDGRFLVFLSSGDLTADDTSAASQVFEYDSREETLVRVSIGQCPSPSALTCASGERFNDNGNTDTDSVEIAVPDFTQHDSPTDAGSQLSVSNDGANVFFNSNDALTKGATVAADAGAMSVYEYRSVGSIANGNVYLISDGKDVTRNNTAFGSQLVSTDAAGGDVFFITGDPLLAADANGDRDMYDARIAGGFAEPRAQGSCTGEECQGARSPGALFISPDSASTVAGGNLTPPPPPAVKPKPRPVKCKRGFTRKHGKCVRARKRPKRARQSANARSGGKK